MPSSTTRFTLHDAKPGCGIGLVLELGRPVLPAVGAPRAEMAVMVAVQAIDALPGHPRVIALYTDEINLFDRAADIDLEGPFLGGLFAIDDEITIAKEDML